MPGQFNRLSWDREIQAKKVNPITRPSKVSTSRKFLMPQTKRCLNCTSYSGSSIQMSNIRLDRTNSQRPIRSHCTYGVAKRNSLRNIAQFRPSAVRFNKSNTINRDFSTLNCPSNQFGLRTRIWSDYPEIGTVATGGCTA
nr:hypothetical protein [Rhodococcus sp. MTM3W5.2]